MGFNTVKKKTKFSFTVKTDNYRIHSFNQGRKLSLQSQFKHNRDSRLLLPEAEVGAEGGAAEVASWQPHPHPLPQQQSKTW